MKRIFRILGILLLLVSFGYTLYYLWDKSRQSPLRFEHSEAYYSDIVYKSLANGSIVPREEVDIKPQVSGIIDEIYVEAGDVVERGREMARIEVIPDMVSLNNAQNRVKMAELSLKNARREFERSRELHEARVISDREFQQVELSFNNARQELEAAEDNLQIVKEGATLKGGRSSLTLVRATVSGMVLDVPVKMGNQVIESNTFNEGTTIATVANMRDMVFEGQIDESEVDKIQVGMPIRLSVGAVQDREYQADLEYIAPRGTEENGAIQFLIRARVKLDSTDFIRAGYSANANIILDERDSVLVVDESLLQYEGDRPFVEVQTGENEYEKRYLELGLSDGLKVEVLSGVEPGEKIKEWHRSL